MQRIVLCLVLFGLAQAQKECKPTDTIASGTHAPHVICSGDLILNENFNVLNDALWKRESAMGGGGNGEFQWYTNSPANSFVADGKLVIRPTLTKDAIGEHELEHGHIKLEPCTNPNWNGCEKTANPDDIIQPIQSGRVHTEGAFSFKYGILEVNAKLPAGDWLWPAFWLLPQYWKYGVWPKSGEIDLMEGRGNRNFTDHNGVQINTEQFGSTLHFGPEGHSAWYTSTFSKNLPSGQGLDQGFHRYKLEWTSQYLRFFLDDVQVGEIPVGDGFWKRGRFTGDDIWKSGTKMAPFDEEFYLIFNLAVGGTNGYFPDEGNVGGKPWSNSGARSATAFWRGRSQWLPTWKLHENDGRQASLMIDSVKVWAL